jgi:hypothetical protein
VSISATKERSIFNVSIGKLAEPKQLDALVDRLVPMRGKHRAKKIDAGIDGYVVEPVGELDA